TWVGVKLDEPCEDPRQDGTFLDGRRYFETEPGYALWTRPEATLPSPAIRRAVLAFHSLVVDCAKCVCRLWSIAVIACPTFLLASTCSNFLSVESRIFMTMNKPKVYVAGVGMTPFIKPGRKDIDYVDLGTLAIQRALRDAGISGQDIEAAYAGYVYGDSTCGQRVIYQAIGCTGIPVVNVNNNCR
ncbi:sterol carrier protein 2, partial [Perkinsus olseni]